MHLCGSDSHCVMLGSLVETMQCTARPNNARSPLAGTRCCKGLDSSCQKTLQPCFSAWYDASGCKQSTWWAAEQLGMHKQM